jgi:hypothetical protein
MHACACAFTRPAAAPAPVQDVPLIQADTHDQDAVDAAVKQAKVVIACAGPFAKLGTPVVDACVRHGSHYVDITGARAAAGAAACPESAGEGRSARCAERGRCAGEIPWVARIIEQYHDRAAQKGVKIVPCCGFDSIPSDLGALLVATHIRNKLNRRARAAGWRAAFVACAARGRRSVACALSAGCPAVRAHSVPPAAGAQADQGGDADGRRGQGRRERRHHRQPGRGRL